jgi:hypothetical protein
MHRVSGSCATCAHWGVSEYGPRPFLNDSAKRCDALQASGLVEVDGEPFAGGVIGTAPTFCCVLFEERPDL